MEEIERDADLDEGGRLHLHPSSLVIKERYRLVVRPRNETGGGAGTVKIEAITWKQNHVGSHLGIAIDDRRTDRQREVSECRTPVWDRKTIWGVRVCWDMASFSPLPACQSRLQP